MCTAFACAYVYVYLSLHVCRYWWAKIRGLASIDDYEELEKFSKQKKSPIGYEASCMCMYVECTLLDPEVAFSFQPFAEVCIQRRNQKEAAKYIPKCAPEVKYHLYLRIE